MLEMREALQALRVLDRWAATQNSRLDPVEVEAIEAILLSPAGRRAAGNLGYTFWLVRHLLRVGTGKFPAALDSFSISICIRDIEKQRDENGMNTVDAHRKTLRAILASWIGARAASNITRLDAVVTELFAITPKKARSS